MSDCKHERITHRSIIDGLGKTISNELRCYYCHELLPDYSTQAIELSIGKPLADMIPLDHAAEVLAKYIYEAIDWSEVFDDGVAAYVVPWEKLPDDEKQQYINEAIEELKK